MGAHAEFRRRDSCHAEALERQCDFRGAGRGQSRASQPAGGAGSGAVSSVGVPPLRQAQGSLSRKSGETWDTPTRVELEKRESCAAYRRTDDVEPAPVYQGGDMADWN